MTSYDAVVVGSGVIGLTTAWHLSQTGRRVAIVDPSPARGASWAAAGMLAPVTETTYTETSLVELNLEAAARWPEFAAALEQAAGRKIGFRRSGTLLVAFDSSDRAALEELWAFLQSLGLPASWANAASCREIEPLLAPGCRGGILATDDHQVDNRRLIEALIVAAAAARVEAIRALVSEVTTAGGCVTGVVAGGRELSAPLVVLAAGWATSSLGGLPAGTLPPIRPVKGQILRLRTPDGQCFCDHTVRALVRGAPVYAVSRQDGEVVVGATQEERGDDRSVTAGAVYTLLRDAIRILPGLGELEQVEATSGLRPAAPDNAPVVGPTAVGGLVLATGHFRHGILLAPLTAKAIVSLVEEGDLPGPMARFAPARLVGAGVR